MNYAKFGLTSGCVMYLVLGFMDLVTNSVHAYIFVATGAICFITLGAACQITDEIKTIKNNRE